MDYHAPAKSTVRISMNSCKQEKRGRHRKPRPAPTAPDRVQSPSKRGRGGNRIETPVFRLIASLELSGSLELMAQAGRTPPTRAGRGPAGRLHGTGGAAFLTAIRPAKRRADTADANLSQHKTRSALWRRKATPTAPSRSTPRCLRPAGQMAKWRAVPKGARCDDGAACRAGERSLLSGLI
jgi:hypothetical protein